MYENIANGKCHKNWGYIFSVHFLINFGSYEECILVRLRLLSVLILGTCSLNGKCIIVFDIQFIEVGCITPYYAFIKSMVLVIRVTCGVLNVSVIGLTLISSLFLISFHDS